MPNFIQIFCKAIVYYCKNVVKILEKMHNFQQLHSYWLLFGFWFSLSSQLIFMFVAEKESWFWGTVSYYIFMKY